MEFEISIESSRDQVKLSQNFSKIRNKQVVRGSQGKFTAQKVSKKPKLPKGNIVKSQSVKQINHENDHRLDPQKSQEQNQLKERTQTPVQDKKANLNHIEKLYEDYYRLQGNLQIKRDNQQKLEEEYLQKNCKGSNKIHKKKDIVNFIGRMQNDLNMRNWKRLSLQIQKKEDEEETPRILSLSPT